LEQGRDQLRQRLARRGLTLSVPLLATLLAEGQTPAAVPALLVASVVRVATEFALGQAAAVPPVVLSLAEGVLRTMFLNKPKIAAAAVILLAVVGTGVGLWLRPMMAAAPVDPAAAEEQTGTRQLPKPGQVAVGKPDKNGLVTMLRPQVTRLAAGDPLRI